MSLAIVGLMTAVCVIVPVAFAWDATRGRAGLLGGRVGTETGLPRWTERGLMAKGVYLGGKIGHWPVRANGTRLTARGAL